MRVELISVGSELISGKVINTNASYISQKLLELGHTQTRQFTVDDNIARISELVKSSLDNCEALIVTGGLGPTDDDITKEAVCKALDIRLVENKKCKEHIEKHFAMLGRTPTQNNYKQALAPEYAEIFKNDCGTACGFGIDYDGKKVILLPGPPKELIHMFESYVIPYLKKLDRKAVVSHTLNLFGMGESAIETAIRPLFVTDNPVVVTYCKDNECEISITATADSEDEAERLCSQAVFKIKSLLGDIVYGTDSKGMANEVVKLLKQSNLKVSTAESCTGGMLSQSLTSVQGASDVVEIGIVAYSNRIKNEALSVPLDVLMEEGAISAETAMYLAKNVRTLSDADIGVGITGNAGPTASENKPIGLVYVAIADRSKYYITKLELPSGYSREKIRNYATLTALNTIRKYILARPSALDGMRSYDDDFFFDDTKEEASFKEQNESFAVFKVDESYNFDTHDNISKEENIEKVELDINSFISEEVVSQPEIFKNIVSFAKKHWIKLVSTLVLLVLVATSTVLIGNLVHEGRQTALINTARDSFDITNENKSEDTGIFRSFDKLLKQNPDIIGWITIDGTNINNPVYQSTNNQYYQTHNMIKEKSHYGALFFDKNNVIENNSVDKNLTIYGHNTTNGTMFGELDSYHSLSFYKNNPIIKLKTLYSQNEYIIFSVFITNADEDDDNGQIFNYARREFKDEKDFAAFISEAKKRSLITVPIAVNADDTIITLSTRSDEFENARFVVMAKKITTQNESSLVSKSTLNENTKYPQAWYDKNGLEGYKEKQSTPTSSEIVSSDITSSVDDSSVETPSDTTSSDTPSSSTPTSSIDSSSAPSSSIVSSNSNPSSSQEVSTADPATCSHAPGKYENKTAEDHTYKCAKCGTVIKEAHEFVIESVGDAYLAQAATCTTPSTYFKSCKCLIKGTDTFVVGEALNHKPSAEFIADETHHWKICENSNCAEILERAEHSYTNNNKCVCGKENSAQQ